MQYRIEEPRIKETGAREAPQTGGELRMTGQQGDLGAVFDAHVASEFVARDVGATMATMTDDPYVNHVPTMMGGVGREQVESFYQRHFIGQWRADTTITPVSRTQDGEHVVDEMIIKFTHDVTMDAILPGVPPTGRPLAIPAVVVMGFDGGKVAYENVYWDQASLLAQVGLIDASTLPVTGAEQADKILDKDLPANHLLTRRPAGGTA
jgi:carboxymethylenebutenolidase